MSKFTTEQQDAFAWVYEIGVQPGQFATVRQDSEEAIRARLNEWSIRLPWADINGREI